MKIIRQIFLVISIGLALQVNAQSIDKHLWKKRVLLLVVSDSKNEDYQKQLVLLQSDNEGLDDRKLVVYTLMPHAYAKGFKDLRWQTSKNRYKDLKKSSKPFEMILIGLDGDIKLRQTGVVELQALYSLIDAMPMRANELSKRKGKQ